MELISFCTSSVAAYFRHPGNPSGGTKISEDGNGDQHAWKCAKVILYMLLMNLIRL